MTPESLKGANFDRPSAALLDDDEVKEMEELEAAKKKAPKKAPTMKETY